MKLLAKSCRHYSGNGGPCRFCSTDYIHHFRPFAPDGSRNDWDAYNGWAKFGLNGATYRTDAATIAILRSIVPSAKSTGDHSALIAVLDLGLKAGRIAKLAGGAS